MKNAGRNPLIWLGVFIVSLLIALTIAQPAWLSRLPVAFDELLNERRAALLSENDMLLGENDVLRRRLTEAEAIISQRTTLTARLEAEIEGMSVDLVDRRNRIEQVSSELTTAARERDALNETLTLRIKERDDLEKRLAESDLALRETEAENRRLLEDRTAMARELESLNTTNRDLRTSLQQVQQEAGVRSAAIDRDALDIRALRDRLDAKGEALASLEDELKRMDADRTNSRQALDRAERKIADLTRREGDLVKRLTESRHSLREADTARNEIEAQLGETTADLADRTAHVSGLEKKIASRDKEITSRDADVERLEADIAALETEGERLKALVDASDARAAKLAEQAATAAADLTQMTAERDRQRQELEAAKDRLRSVQQSAKAREENLVSLERELTAMTDRGFLLEKERRQRRAEIDGLIAEQTSLGREIIRLAGLLASLDRAMRRQRNDASISP